MKGLIKEGTRPYAFQRGIPHRFRDRFEGKAKFYKSLDTHDYDEAVRRGSVVARDFENRCGFIDGPVFNVPVIAGKIFDQVLNRDEFVELRECADSLIVELQHEGHPLVNGFPLGGPTFESLVTMLEQMCREAEGASYRPGMPVQRVSKTLMEQAQAWRKLPSPLSDKTRDQYVKDAKDFSAWYRSALRKPAIGAGITKKDVNAYVESRMKHHEPQATINRRLSGLRKIYKSGQFSDDNPFAGVSDRIDVHGPKLTVRAFTDGEVRLILREMAEFDENVQWATRIGLYTGMRLSEMCSLRVPDLEHVMIGKEKVYYFRLGQQAGRKLKTEASYRFIPVHPTLVPGLLKLIKGREDYLLNEPVENKYASRSAAISKRLNRLIDRVAPEPEVREHSFRHTVISKLADAGVREELRKALVGHTGGDPHDGYNHAMRIRELSDAIRLLEY